MSPEAREETEQLAHSQCDKGLRLSQENRADEAIQEFNKAERNFETLQNFRWLNFLRKEKLTCLQKLNRQDEIFSALEDLEKGCLETHDRDGLVQTLINKGEYCNNKDEYQSSLKSLNAARYLLKIDRGLSLFGSIPLKMAQNKIGLEEYVEALEELSGALSNYQRESESQEYLYCLQLAGYCYEKLFQISAAEQQYSQARKGYYQNGDRESEHLILQQLHQLYLDSCQTKKMNKTALELKRFER